MTCIDCLLDCPITVRQERYVGRRLCAWDICRECLHAYERVTSEIAREREAKALGRLASSSGKTASTRPTTSTQGVLG